MRAADGHPSVLLVENEALISLDLCDILHESGYRVIGPANTVTGALFLLRRESPQFAIVDIALKDGSCNALMQMLRERSVPFFIHSSYSRDMLGSLSVPWLSKPSAPADFAAMLTKLSQQVAVQ